MLKEIIEEKKTKKYNLLNVIVLCVFGILVLNLMTIKSDNLFKMIGFRTYTVLSGSMEPEFYPGDLVITQHKDKANIKINDIVTFRDNEGIVITHRIIEETNEGYVTKGDNNSVNDADILKDQDIIGKVKFSIPKVGYVINLLSDPRAIAIEMILLAAFIFFYYKD